MSKEKTSEKQWVNKAAERMARTGIKVQTKFATGMGYLTRNMSTTKLKALLIVFCVGIGGYSVFLFGDALFSTGTNSTITVQKLKVPKHADQAGDENLLSNQYVDDTTYSQLTAFKKYMDSLKLARHPLYDSLIRARPRLLDSVQLLIQAYEELK